MMDKIEVVIDILDQLWDGEISEKSRPKTEEYAAVIKELEAMDAELEKILEPAAYEKVERYISKLCEANEMEHREAFKDGVTFATSIMCQTLTRVDDKD